MYKILYQNQLVSCVPDLKMCYPFDGLVTTDKVYRKYLTILPCAGAINLFPFLKRRRLVGTHEWTFY